MLDFRKRVVWIPVINASGETIPGGALMEPFANPPTHNGQDEDGNWYVRKPTEDGNTRVIVNGEAEIPDGGTGQGHRDTMAVLLYDTTEDLPLSGDQYGSKAGSWQAHKDFAGFRIDHAGNGRANAQRESGAAGLYFSSFGGTNFNGVRYPVYESFNSQLGTAVSETLPFAVYGTLGNLVVPAGQSLRGNTVANVAIATGYSDPSDVAFTVRVFSKWNDTTNDLSNRLTEVEHFQQQAGTFAATLSFNLPLVATNGTGSDRRLTCVAEIQLLGGGAIPGAMVRSTLTTFKFG